MIHFTDCLLEFQFDLFIRNILKITVLGKGHHLCKFKLNQHPELKYQLLSVALGKGIIGKDEYLRCEVDLHGAEVKQAETEICFRLTGGDTIEEIRIFI